MKTFPKLIPSIQPRAVVRATMLGDIMKNYGLPDNVIHIAQTGLMAEEIVGLTVSGFAANGELRERSVTTFDKLVENDNMEVNLNGRSMVEAISHQLAYAVATSVALMRRQNLRIEYMFHIAEYKDIGEVRRKYGLGPPSQPGDTPALRQLFAVSPGRDLGMRFSHLSAI